MTKLAVCLPVLNQEEWTQRSLTSLKDRAKNKDIQFIIIDNGCDRFVREWLKGLTGGDIVIKNQKNVGLPKALNQALSVNKAEYLFATHSDVEMFEQDWDEKVIKAIDEAGNVGVAGFFGALGIGSPEIYKTPYVMQQLVRIRPIAGNRCKLAPHIHGQMQFMEDWKECAVLDGFSLIVHNSLKFWRRSVHHMYDSDVCLESIQSGKKNIVINMDIDHYGGKTDVGEDWASPFGKTKAEIHSEAHPPFYEKWRGLLPYLIK